MKGPARRKRRFDAPPGSTRHVRQLWRIVDGAVLDALNMHPDYLAPKGSRGDTARRSITKRVVGSLLGFVDQTEGRAPIAADRAIVGSQAMAPGGALSTREPRL